MGLTTHQLDRILSRNPVTQRLFLGTYPSCMTPNTRKRKYTFIQNTQEHDGKGIHWCAWMVDGDKITFFDSFGRHPLNPAFPLHFKDIIHGFKLHYNNKRVQDFSSAVCGHYCIHFLYSISLGLDLEFMLCDYGRDFKDNDRFVYKLINNSI